MPPQAQEQSKSLAQRVIEAVPFDTFVAMLPAPYRPMANRMLLRAQLYIKKSKDLQECTLPSLVQCILDAGQSGFCLDGKMAHAVKFNTKISKKGEPDRWAAIATYMPDFKGLVDMARRHGQIIECHCHHRHQNDAFSYRFTGGKWEFDFEPMISGPRGLYLGTWCALNLPSGQIAFEYMEREEIEHIRHKSKAKDSGPWVTDWPEMAKKTVIRRTLKRFATDPELADLLDRDDAAMGIIDEIADTEDRTAPVPASGRKLDHLTQRLSHQPSNDWMQDAGMPSGGEEERETVEEPRGRQQETKREERREEREPEPQQQQRRSPEDENRSSKAEEAFRYWDQLINDCDDAEDLLAIQNKVDADQDLSITGRTTLIDTCVGKHSKLKKGRGRK